MNPASHIYNQMFEEHWDPVIHLEFMGLFEPERKIPEQVKGEVKLVHEYMKSGRYLN